MPNLQVVSFCVIPHLLKRKKKEVQLSAEAKEPNVSGLLIKSLVLAEKNI